MRRFIEQVTGVATGSDKAISECFDELLMGLIGSGHTADEKSVWMTATHYPFGTGDEAKFSASKSICVVRNPLDVIASYAQFTNLMSHSLVTKQRIQT